MQDDHFIGSLIPKAIPNHRIYASPKWALYFSQSCSVHNVTGEVVEFIESVRRFAAYTAATIAAIPPDATVTATAVV